MSLFHFIIIAPPGAHGNYGQPAPAPQPHQRSPSSPPGTSGYRSSSPNGERKKNRKSWTKAIRGSRSISLRDTDPPAALLVGDYMIAPLYEWVERMRAVADGGSDSNDNATDDGDDASRADDNSIPGTMPGTPLLNGSDMEPSGGENMFRFCGKEGIIILSVLL